MRRRTLLPVVSLLALLVHAAAALAAPAITLTGRGYGHGVGMSQYGAQGMALAGADHTAILAHYYPGAELTEAPGTAIRVLLASAKRVSFLAPAGTRVDSGRGARPVSGPLTARRAGAEVQLTSGGQAIARGATIRLAASQEPIVVGTVPYSGTIALSVGTGGVLAVEETDLDEYVRGVVAREMPTSWAPAALEAQAIAARTYALATRKPDGPFDVYADVRSQVYGGVAAQTAASDAAVAATKGLILTYEGEPIVAYFHSSSGGRTANVEDVLGGEPRPYLIAVPDPTDAVSPYHRWKPQRFTRAALGRAVGLGRPVRMIRQRLTPSGRVRDVTFRAGARHVTFTGTALRWKLGLRSSWFRFAVKKPVPARRPAAAHAARETPAQAIARKIARLGPPAGATPARGGGRPLLEAGGGPVRSLDDVAPYVPDDPLLAARQWNLGADGIGAFPLPVASDLIAAAPVVRVAIVDGGIDRRSPDLEGLVPDALRKSFVPGRPIRASMHGTLVAGLVAAHTGNGLALAAPGVRVELMDLQVVSGDGAIQPRYEAAAIRWAADHGARVINLSLGALRDPRSGGQRTRADGFSPAEAAAVRYAVARGALVVAAVGNGIGGRAWAFADWPAALPHVLGVGAVRRDRAPAAFSNRDAQHVDLAAPGVGLVSTVPIFAAASGVSIDAAGKGGGTVDQNGEVRGTSFAAPQVSGTAALLFALRPDLTASQVSRLLVETARDVNRAGRDPATGSGELDVTAVVARASAGVDVPADDDLEPNDDAGAQAPALPAGVRVVRATADRFDDSLDVYRVALHAGDRLEARLRGPAQADFDLLVSAPGGGSIAGLGRDARRRVVAGSFTDGTREHVAYRAPRAGYYNVGVWAAAGSGAYELVIRRTPA